MRSFQFGLGSIFLLTTFAALLLAILATRDEQVRNHLITFTCNAIACAIIFGIPLWLASWPER